MPSEPIGDVAQRALRHAPCALISFGDDGRILFVNQQASALLDEPERDLLGRQFDRLLTAASRVFHSTHFFPLLKLHGKAEEIHLVLKTTGGTEVPVSVSGVRETDGSMSVTHCAIMTMWRRKEFEGALVAARNTAESATRAKDQFLAIVSHELRTPLNAMLGWTRLAQSDTLDERQRRHALETIERNARVQARLIEDLLDLSRVVSGKLRLSPRPVQLAPIIEAAVDTTRPAALAKGVALALALDTTAGLVYADPERVQQIGWNLVSNAVKFTPKGGRVQITLVRAESRVRLDVADTGAGISASALPFIFDRFWQADTVHAPGGMGLGLAISKSLVELHGGTIEAHSDGPATGARFTVEFPIAVAAGADEMPSRNEGSPAPSLQGVRVLVVDDQEDALRMLQLILESAGAAVRTASSCDEAIVALHGQPTDVLVSDIGMPGRDGYALIAQLRNESNPETRGLPAIAVTGMSRAQDRVALLRAGFQAHLCKPVEPSEVVALVGALALRF